MTQQHRVFDNQYALRVPLLLSPSVYYPGPNFTRKFVSGGKEHLNEKVFSLKQFPTSLQETHTLKVQPSGCDNTTTFESMDAIDKQWVQIAANTLDALTSVLFCPSFSETVSKFMQNFVDAAHILTYGCEPPNPNHQLAVKLQAKQVIRPGEFELDLLALFSWEPVAETSEDADGTVNIHFNGETMEAYVSDSKTKKRDKVSFENDLCDYMSIGMDALGQYTLSCEKVTSQQ